MGLNAFKIVGVSYAINRLLREGLLTEGAVLACATDGNHGRAVARVARQHGFPARIYVHASTSRARIQAIETEGAHVTVVDGSYDDAVRQAKSDAQNHGWTIISDTSWPGYETVPRYIMAGYTILLQEAWQQWSAQDEPDILIVQVCVGALLCAVMSWLCFRYGPQRPYVISCEPVTAACALRSIQAGRPIEIVGPLDTIMAGLSCGHVSFSAWPIISATVDAFISVDEASCKKAMRKLAQPPGGDPAITSGESGACGIAALMTILQNENFRSIREASGLSRKSRVLAFNTEGATDPQSYAQIINEPETDE